MATTAISPEGRWPTVLCEPPRPPGFLALMKNRCLPGYLILRNILILLLATAGLVYYAAELQARSNQPNLKAVALRQIFAYQLLHHLQSQ